MRLTSGGLSWVLVGLCWAASGALAQPVETDHQWLRVQAERDACIQSAELARAVDDLLGSQGVPEGVRIEVFAQTGAHVRFRLRHGTGHEAERDLEGLPLDCAGRLEAVALALTLAIEHAMAMERARSDSPPHADADPEVEVEDEPEPPAQPVPAPVAAPDGVPLRVDIALLGGATLGLLPELVGEGQLAATAHIGARLSLQASVGASSRARVSFAEGQLDVRALLMSLGVCAGGQTGDGHLSGCLWPSWSAVLGRGQSLSQSQRDTTAAGTLGVGLWGSWPVRGRLHVCWRAEGFAHWLRPRYEALSTGGEVVTSRTFPRGGGRIVIGLGWQARRMGP